MLTREQDSMKRTLKSEKEKLKTMNFKEKCVYIFDYYKFPIIAIIAAIAIISYIIYAYTHEKENYLSGICINTIIADEKVPYLTDNFAAYANIDTKKFNINFDPSITLSANATDEYSMASMSKVTVWIYAKTLDIILSNQEFMDYFAGHGAFEDITTVLPADLTAQLQDYFYYSANDEGQTIPVGVDISKTTFAQNLGLKSDDTFIFGIVTSSQHTDNAIEYLRYILSY